MEGKEPKKKTSFVGLVAFIGVIAFAVLAIFDFLAAKNILRIGNGTVFTNIITTLLNLIVIIVFGAVSYNYAKGKKAKMIIFIVSIIVIIVMTVLIWAVPMAK